MIWYFFCYSFLGFLLEVVYARVIRTKKVDRKCRLLLPICPVYGIGGTAIVLLPPFIQTMPVLLFLFGAMAATFTEYVTAVFYERVWKVKFWDYSDLPGNVQGRVCLPFFAIWGALAIPLCYMVHPVVAAVVSALPDALLIPLVLVFAVDLALTGHILRRTQTTEALRWYRV